MNKTAAMPDAGMVSPTLARRMDWEIARRASFRRMRVADVAGFS